MNLEAGEIFRFKERLLPISNICHISCADSNKAWISNDKGDIRLLDIHKKGEETDLGMSGTKGLGIHSISIDEQLLYIDTMGNIKKRSSDGQIVVFKELKDWKATCICFSKLNGDVLVARSNHKVERYTIQGQEIIYKDFQYDGEPTYIAENFNGDICISDQTKKALIVFDKSGKLKFSYKGDPKDGPGFVLPYGICSDKSGRIFLYDDYIKGIHVINKDGRFLGFLRKMDKTHLCSYGICMDQNDNMWIVSSDNTLFLYKLQERGGDSWMDMYEN